MKLVCTLKEQLGIIHTALCNYPYYQNSITYKRSEYDYAKIHLLNSDPKQLINIEDVYLELIKQGNSLKFVNNEDYES